MHKRTITDGTLTRTRVVGGHFMARRLDAAYASYLVLGICLGITVFAVHFQPHSGRWSTLLGLAATVAAPIGFATVFLVLWNTIKFITIWPLLTLALLGVSALVGAVALAEAGDAAAAGVVGFALAGVYVTAPFHWFLAGRKRLVARRFAMQELSPAAGRVLCIVSIMAGVAGCLLWPLIWHAHYRHSLNPMGGWTGGRMTLIFLGFLPFLALVVAGVAKLPERHSRRHGPPPPQ